MIYRFGFAVAFATLSLTGCQLKGDLIGTSHATPANDNGPAGGGGQAGTAKNNKVRMPYIEMWDGGSVGDKVATTKLEVKCEPKKENNICNGLDDDCDGQIDEECGLKTGGIQIVGAWDDAAEIDLVLTSDNTTGSIGYRWGGGAEIHGGNRHDGFTLRNQHNAKGSCGCKSKYKNGPGTKVVGCSDNCELNRGRCWAKDSKQYVENIYLDRKIAPSGTYEVKFNKNSRCGMYDETRVRLTVVVNGKNLGTYLSNDLDVQTTQYPILKIHVP